MDYPADKLRVHLICDGCLDDTVAYARAAAVSPECANLDLRIEDCQPNRGKLHQLNRVIPTLRGPLVALTDASAILSFDALLVAAAHFRDSRIAAVGGRYELHASGGSGQTAYWRYQVAIKQSEDALGSAIGLHGAFYVMRQILFRPLPADTINDDFILPMLLVKDGYRVRYDPRICALELEHLAARDEHGRRRRLSAGNVQQVLRLWQLLSPHYRGTAFTFGSGKALRVFMPFCLLLLWFGSLVLVTRPIFAALAAAQTLSYGAVLWHHALPRHPRSRLLEVAHYVVAGHLATLQGWLDYSCGRVSWRRK